MTIIARPLRSIVFFWFCLCLYSVLTGLVLVIFIGPCNLYPFGFHFIFPFFPPFFSQPGCFCLPDFAHLLYSDKWLSNLDLHVQLIYPFHHQLLLGIYFDIIDLDYVILTIVTVSWLSRVVQVRKLLPNTALSLYCCHYMGPMPRPLTLVGTAECWIIGWVLYTQAHYVLVFVYSRLYMCLTFNS